MQRTLLGPLATKHQESFGKPFWVRKCHSVAVFKYWNVSSPKAGRIASPDDIRREGESWCWEKGLGFLSGVGSQLSKPRPARESSQEGSCPFLRSTALWTFSGALSQRCALVPVERSWAEPAYMQSRAGNQARFNETESQFSSSFLAVLFHQLSSVKKVIKSYKYQISIAIKWLRRT